MLAEEDILPVLYISSLPWKSLLPNMTNNRDRVYWNDSKTTVRAKLGLQDNEDFSKFENICSNAYRFKLSFDPTLNWDKLDRLTVTDAQSLIKSECMGANLKLVDEDVVFNDFIEWKLYQLHKPVHGRMMKRSRQNDSVPAKSSDHTTQASASTPKPVSSRGFDPVKAAAQDARDAK